MAMRALVERRGGRRDCPVLVSAMECAPRLYTSMALLIQDRLSRIVSRATGNGTAGMRSGATEPESLDRRPVGRPGR